MRRLYIIFLTLLSILILSSCVKNADQNIYCTVTLEAVLPDGGDIITLEIDDSLKGNFFRNYNTHQEYEFPIFANNKCKLTVLKGLYLIAFDGTAQLSDGTYVTVRSAEYTAMAASLLEDEQTLTLNLTIL